MTKSLKHISSLEAKHELWRRGLLSWKLDPHQKELYELFHESDHKIQTWLLSRRFGKTFSLCVLALEACLKTPNTIVKFLSPTKLQVNNNIRPLIREITEDCPEELKPEFKSHDFIYYFQNGSELQLAGSESGHAEKLRGGSSYIAIVDEAQLVTDLDNIVKSILLPTTLTTRGKILLAGTPPKSTDHDFINFIEEAEVRGSLIRKDVYENKRLTKEDLETTLNEYPLREQSEEFRREYLCQIIKDPTISVIPEFTPELEKEIIKADWPKPPFFDSYVSMDLGYVDLTALLFGYYDFRSGKLIIEDEILADFTKSDMNIRELTTQIKAKEEKLWINVMTSEVREPYLRVSDINPIAVKEINIYSHGKINFINAKKDDKESAINNTRMLLGSKKIIIHPRCVNLIRHLQNVKWASAKNHNTFGRSPDNGHYDFVDALIYMVRSVSYSKNPYPANYQLNMENIHIVNPENFYNKKRPIDVYKKLFNIKDRKGR